MTKGHTEEVKKGKLEKGDDVELTIARQASILHENSVLAMGTIQTFHGAPKIVGENPKIGIEMGDEDATPERIQNKDYTNPYLKPYNHFQTSPFGKSAGFPGLFPKDANAILKFALKQLNVEKTTALHFDTKYRDEQYLINVPISNISFITREANVTEMHADFWIMELHKPHESAAPEFIKQYSQTVYLEFFESDDKDEKGKLILWPHVSINTLRKT